VLLNADFLTIDAQSALRRCIELFSFNTRFFIIVENKHKLLNPILSRFCDIYIPETIGSQNTSINLHQHTIQQKYLFDELKRLRMTTLCEKMSNYCLIKIKTNEITHKDLVILVTELYESGYSCLDIITWIKNNSEIEEKEKSAIVLVFYKIKSEYRCEKLLMLYILDYAFLRQNKAVKNIGFM
jgi:DNA polymerase III delta prime subunit